MLKQNGSHLFIHGNNSNYRLQWSKEYCNQCNVILPVNLSIRAMYKKIMVKDGLDNDITFFIFECKKGKVKTSVFSMNAVSPAVNFRRNPIQCL